MTKWLINSRSTLLAKAILIKRFLRRNTVLLNLLFWLIGSTSVVVVVLYLIRRASQSSAGLALIGLAVFLLFIIFETYIDYLLADQRGSAAAAKLTSDHRQPVNIFSAFSSELGDACLELFSSGHRIFASDFIQSVLSARGSQFILNRLGLSRNTIKNEASTLFGDIGNDDLLQTSLDTAIANNHGTIWSGDVLSAASEIGVRFATFLQKSGVSAIDVANVLAWQTRGVEAKTAVKSLEQHLKLTGGIGRDWNYGYTNFLRQYSIDLTEAIRKSNLKLDIIGREKEIAEIEQSFYQRVGGNVLVVGDAGVGKRTVILGFAERIMSGRLPALSNYHIFELDTDAVVAGKTDGLVRRFAKILEEGAAAGNAVIFIENIDRIFSASEDKVSRVDLSEVLLPYLDHSSVHIIGSCDVEGYNNFILKSSALTERFVRVSVAEPDPATMIKILENTAAVIEAKTGGIISYEAIQKTLDLADRHILNQPNPEKSIALLDGAAVMAAKQRGETILIQKDIEAYVAVKYEVPASEIGAGEKVTLLELEKEIHKQIIGQDTAVKALSDALRRARTGVENSAKPMGSFLFLGPTGVGKTATAKALAEVYFGGTDKMIRFDMSEYQNNADIYRLIGKRGEAEQGNLVTAVTEHPFSLLLFDEIEKAHPDILNLFLQILDEGIVTTGTDQKVSFASSIIIATSNAGADLIRETIRQAADYSKCQKQLVDYLVEHKVFKPELLNRFTGIIAFSPLSPAEVEKIAHNKLKGLVDKIFEDKGIILNIEAEAVAALAKQGFDPVLGARPLERTIEEKIDNLIAQKILKDEVKKGDTLVIHRSDVE